MNVNAAQQARIEKVLNTLVRYEEGVMTRRNWIEDKVKEGWKVFLSEKNRVQFNRIKFNRMDYKEQGEYEKKCAEKIPCYVIKKEGVSSFWEITKIEFDYAKGL